MNEVDKQIIAESIKTESGWRAFVSERLVVIDDKLDAGQRKFDDYNNRILSLETDNRDIKTTWRTIKWTFGILWGVVIFLVGLLYTKR